jgi:hypothetical protein
MWWWREGRGMAKGVGVMMLEEGNSNVGKEYIIT